MKKLKIYLAGAMMNCKSFKEMNNWRRKIKKLLQDIAENYHVELDVVNPVDYYNFEEKRHQTEREPMIFDLNHVKTSDIVIVNLEGLNKSIGTSIELYECYKNNIPVIAFGNENLYNKLHPWVKEYILRVEINDKSAVSFIQDFYLT